MAIRNPPAWMWAEACEMLEQAQRLQRQFFRFGRAGEAQPRWEPPVDIVAYGDEVQVTVALPGVAPEHVRNFLQLAQAGVLDGTAFHRVVRGFVVQTGALNTRAPLTEKQQKFVHNLQPEFNGTKHVKGIVSMARGDDPASATTSFFIVTADAPTLDGKYTVFGRVIDGLDVLDKIESAPVSGESPTTRIDLIKVRIVG